MRMEEQYDALLYLRPRTSWSNAMVSPALCADANVRGNAYKSHGVGRVESDQFEDYCGKVRPSVK